MRYHAPTLALAACAASPARPETVPEVRQHQDDLTSPSAGKPAAAPKGKKIGFNVPEGWEQATEVTGPGNVYAVFIHASPIGVIAADVRTTGTQTLADAMHGWRKDIDDAKIMAGFTVSDDGMHGSFSWTSATDGTGNSGYATFVRFPELPGKTFAFLGFWDTPAHEALKPAVDEMSTSATVSDDE